MKLWHIINTFTLMTMLSVPYAFAGFSSSYGGSSYTFTYEVAGEIEVKPDSGVLPLVIKVSGNTYNEALEQTRRLLDTVNSDLAALGVDAFSTSPSDFFKPHPEGRKFIDMSFFAGDDEDPEATVVFHVHVAFADQDDFWRRASLMAKANDFVASLEKKYEKNEKIAISAEQTYYEIADIEQYRGEIIRSIYSKAHQMAQIVAEAEGVDLRVDQVTFDQTIDEEILNFSRASLSIDAKIKFTFDSPSEDAR